MLKNFKTLTEKSDDLAKKLAKISEEVVNQVNFYYFKRIIFFCFQVYQFF